jgi:hypothetical protein
MNMETERTFNRKGRAERIPVLKPGRPAQRSSYRQRFFAELDTLEVMEYLEVGPENRDKAIAYCYQMNAAVQGKRFAASTMEGGMVRIFREN